MFVLKQTSSLKVPNQNTVFITKKAFSPSGIISGIQAASLSLSKCTEPLPSGGQGACMSE